MTRALPLGLLLTSSALAAPITSVPADFFYPSPETITQQCAAGRAKAAAPKTQPIAANNLIYSTKTDTGEWEYTVNLDLAGDLVYQADDMVVTLFTLPRVWEVVCARLADGQPSPTVEKVQRTAQVTLRVFSAVRELGPVRQWRGELALLDASGREIRRIEPTSSLQGRLTIWKTNCADGTCVWSGFNQYNFPTRRPFYFDLSKSLPQAKKLRVIFTGPRGEQHVDLELK